MLKRLLTNIVFPRRRLRRAFPDQTLAAIERAITESERSHLGEIRFAVEAALDPERVIRRQSGRARAIEVFSQLHVWDTERNNGVLIYVLLADHDVEIVADRGIAKHVPDERWQAICHTIEQAFRAGAFEGGSIAAIGEISALLTHHFPAVQHNPNELPDKPYIL